MNNKLMAILAVALLALVSQASAQDTLLDYVVDACEGDLTQYCSQVTPGEGRLLHCVAAHQDKLSGQCEYALYKAATLLEQMAAAISYFAQSCETEIKTLCSDVQAGEGRILACLDENSAQVGDTCKKAIADTVEQ
jgi:hypothetical protein